TAQAPAELLRWLNDDEVWAQLKTAAVTHDETMSPFESYFANTLANLDAHFTERGLDIDKLTTGTEDGLNKLENELKRLQEKARNQELRAAIGAADLETLQGFPATGADKGVRSAAIGVIRRLQDLRQENAVQAAVQIVDAIRGIAEVAPEQQQETIKIIYEKYSEGLVGIIGNLKVLRVQLERKEKPEAQLIAEMIGLLLALKEAASKTEKPTDQITAEISFDLKETLKIGRYGASGQGNCQNSTSTMGYNQSLMSFLGDAHELVILIRDGSQKVIGFALLHGVRTEDGRFLFVKEKIYTNLTHLTARQEEAATQVAEKLQSELGIPVVSADEQNGKEM